MPYPLIQGILSLAGSLIRTTAMAVTSTVRTAEAIGASKTFVKAYRIYSVSNVVKSVLDSDEPAAAIAARLLKLPQDAEVEDMLIRALRVEGHNTASTHPEKMALIAGYDSNGPYSHPSDLLADLKSAWGLALVAHPPSALDDPSKFDFPVVSLEPINPDSPMGVIMKLIIRGEQTKKFVDASLPPLKKRSNRVMVVPPCHTQILEREYPPVDSHQIAVPIVYIRERK